MTKAKKDHTCTTGEGVQCVRGKLYDDRVRVVRERCTCTCHNKRGAI